MVFFMFGAESTCFSSLATAGALFFQCREYWGRRAAYLCQFGNPIDRAHIGKAKLKAKLCSPDLDDWRIPPKPPKMRWATYDRLIGQYLKYDAVLGGVGRGGGSSSSWTWPIRTSE